MNTPPPTPTSNLPGAAKALYIALPFLLGLVESCKRAPTPARSAVPDASPVAAPISAAAIEDLIAKWQAAQNAGDVEAYKALYADPFFGIRRSGVQVHSFDRAGWLKDRARMFRKPQHVAVTAIEIGATSPELAKVRFTQEWSSGSYRDAHPTDQQLRKAMWRKGKKLLLGKLIPNSGNCKGAVFARAAELPAPKMAQFEEAKPPWADVGLRLFQAHPLYNKIKARWEENEKDRSPSERGPWDGEDLPEAGRKILIARHPLHDGHLLSITAHREEDEDRVLGVMWLVAEASGTPKAPITAVLNQPAESKSITPLAALDMDGDGRLEFLNQAGLLSAPAEHPLA